MIEVPPKALPVAGITDELLCPTYWLVIGVEWHGDETSAEAAMALALGMVPRDVVSSNIHQVFGCADLYARKHGLRVVFFSDLTRMFAEVGSSWRQLDVDWESALRELQVGQFPAMYLTISEPAYLIICNPTSHAVSLTAGGPKEADDERELVRHAVAGLLARDWPAYMRSVAVAGRLTLV